ncbi:MAG: hypothetical protein EXR60_06985 [Dehalococcoidia bacterium]|nr:hypothetical protein [Dehalococcoidia bacterium]
MTVLDASVFGGRFFVSIARRRKKMWSYRTKKSGSNVADLRASPIHGIKPLSDLPQLIDMDAIEVDDTNPGAMTESLRFTRRDPAIRDSYDIIGGIVYPLVVCEHEDPEKRARRIYVICDGHGRQRQAKARGQAQIWAIIYPVLNLEQRICLRQTLGAAQEPFDAVSVMKGLELLAKQRGLNPHDEADVEVLLRDLPEKVQKYKKDVLMLTRWDLDSAALLGESYKKNSNVIGLDKVRDLTKIVDAVADRHPLLYTEMGGDQGMTKRLAKMYVGKKFSTASRSQEAIRKVASAVKELDQDDPLVKRFFVEELDHAMLTPYAKTRAAAPRDIRELCQELARLLVVANPAELDEGERRGLAALNTLIGSLLK